MCLKIKVINLSSGNLSGGVIVGGGPVMVMVAVSPTLTDVVQSINQSVNQLYIYKAV